MCPRSENPHLTKKLGEADTRRPLRAGPREAPAPPRGVTGVPPQVVQSATIAPTHSEPLFEIVDGGISSRAPEAGALVSVRRKRHDA